MKATFCGSDNRSSANSQTSRRNAACGSRPVDPAATVIELGANSDEQARAHAAARDFARPAPIGIALEQRARGVAERRLRRKSVQHRHVLEDVAHAVAIALAVAFAQHARQRRGIGSRMAGAHEAAHDFGRCAAHRVGVEGVAAEEIDFLQLRKQSRARFAARRALELVHRQRLAHVEAVRVELGAAVEMARDDERVALARGCCTPTRASPAARARPVRRTGSRRAAGTARTSASRRVS